MSKKQVRRKTRLEKIDVALKGPRLVDVVVELIEKHGLTSEDLHQRYGLNKTWLWRIKRDPNQSPNCDTIQVLFEDLSNRPLVQQ